MSEPAPPTPVTTPGTAPSPAPAPAAAPPDPTALLQSKSYLQLLVLAALIGVPISAVAYFYLALVGHLQTWLYTTVPSTLGFHGTPVWWPVPMLVVAAVLVSLIIIHLPGTSGHEPAEGFQTGGTPVPVDLFGVITAAAIT